MTYWLKVNRHTSQVFQELFFKVGGKWCDGNKTITNLNGKYLIVRDLSLTYGNLGDYEGEEVSFEEGVKRLLPKLEGLKDISVIIAAVKISLTEGRTIAKIGGFCFDKKDLESLIKEMK